MAAKKTTTKKRRAGSAGEGHARRDDGAVAEVDATFEKLRRFVRTKGTAFLDDPNVTSVGVGKKPDGTLCLQFTVEEKVKPERAERLEQLGTEVIPKVIDVEGMQVPTDIVERTFKPAYKLVNPEDVVKDPRKQRQNPIMAGYSVSHPDGTAGTLGAIVWDAKTGAVCMLSNWHVLHGGTGEIHDPVVQPGPYDDNRIAQNEAGRLLRSHLGAAGDCAVASVVGRDCDTKVFALNVKIEKLGEPELGDLVVKSGRTTAVTYGIVRRVDVIAKIDYDGAGPQKIGGFEIGPPEGAAATYEVSMGGDSGSAWLAAETDDAGKIVPTNVMLGLHFAGESDGVNDEHALACYAESVFEKLEITIQPPDAALATESVATGRERHQSHRHRRGPGHLLKRGAEAA
jgi:endonuclease G